MSKEEETTEEATPEVASASTDETAVSAKDDASASSSDESKGSGFSLILLPTLLFKFTIVLCVKFAKVCLMGGLPVLLSHAAFAPLFAGLYQLFLWVVANRWTPDGKPLYPYFFMDTTLGVRTSIFMVLLLGVIGLFFVLFALLNRGIVAIDNRGHGALANVCCVVVMARLLMKFGD